MATVDQQHPRARTVVLVVLTRRTLRDVLFRRLGCWRASDWCGIVDQRHAGAKDFQAVLGHRDDRGFEANFTRSAIEQKGRVVAKGFADMRCRGGGKLREAIGTGRCNGHVSFTQKGQRHGMSRHAQAYGGESGCDFIGNSGLFRHDDGEGPGPKLACQALRVFGPFGGKFAGLLDTENVHN
jgi:hypothetical protein